MNILGASDGGPVRVAVIGPEDLVFEVLELRDRYPSLQLMPFPYGEEREVVQLFAGLQGQCDIALFTGPVPYYLVQEEFAGTPLPLLHVNLSGGGLYRTLFLLSQEHDVTRLSLDTFDYATAETAYRELNLPMNGLRLLEYNRAITRDELLDFHVQAYQSRQTEVAMTCVRSVFRELQERNIPCGRIVPSQVSISEALEKTVWLGESIRSKASQLVIGIVQLEPLGKLAHRTGSEHNVHRMRLEIQGALLHFVEEIDGFMAPGGVDEFVFVTTRGRFQIGSSSFTAHALLDRASRLGPIKISVGFGLGQTAHEAGVHARMALQKAAEQGGNVGYLVLEDRRIVGPLGDKFEMEYAERVLDRQMLDKARAAGRSAVYLSKFLAAVRRMGRAEFTVFDVVPFLGITQRSAHRLVDNLCNAGLIELVGEEKLYGRGRPRQVYRLVQPPGQSDPTGGTGGPLPGATH